MTHTPPFEARFPLPNSDHSFTLLLRRVEIA
jgi:hypothetical protein